VRSLRRATDACPAEHPGELSRDLYWLALALLRLDRQEIALKSLASAQKLRPRGYARRAYLLRANVYGMPRRSSPALDDFYAFYSIQACIYLNRRRAGNFESSAEKEAVTRLVGDAWHRLSRSGRLEGLRPVDKLELFRSLKLSFPAFGLGQAYESSTRPREIPADFRRGGRIRGDDRCCCGSGLPYMQCCGRSAGMGERSCE
jgi:hypothetical protein